MLKKYAWFIGTFRCWFGDAWLESHCLGVITGHSSRESCSHSTQAERRSPRSSAALQPSGVTVLGQIGQLHAGGGVRIQQLPEQLLAPWSQGLKVARRLDSSGAEASPTRHPLVEISEPRVRRDVTSLPRQHAEKAVVHHNTELEVQQPISYSSSKCCNTAQVFEISNWFWLKQTQNHSRYFSKND